MVDKEKHITSKKVQTKENSAADFIEQIEKILNIRLFNYQREFLRQALIARARGNEHLLIPVVLKSKKKHHQK